MLGRFLDKDLFVGIRIYDRHDLGGMKYGEAARGVIADWDSTIGPANLKRGAQAGDYLNPVFIDG
jgi:hypothetical protein